MTFQKHQTYLVLANLLDPHVGKFMVLDNQSKLCQGAKISKTQHESSGAKTNISL